MNLIVALFLSEIKRCSCCLGVLDTPQFVSGVLLHTRLSGVLPHAFIFSVCAHASCMKYIEQILLRLQTLNVAVVVLVCWTRFSLFLVCFCIPAFPVCFHTPLFFGMCTCLMYEIY